MPGRKYPKKLEKLFPAALIILALLFLGLLGTAVYVLTTTN